MEIFGGFMVMMSIIGLFLAVIWLVMPFVVFAIKGKQDRTLEVLEGIERRLATLEANLQRAKHETACFEVPVSVVTATEVGNSLPVEKNSASSERSD